MTAPLATLAAPAAEAQPPLACLRDSKQQFLDVVTELRTLMPVGILEALPVFTVDETAAGNALASALNRATGSRLFQQGLTPEQQLFILERHETHLPVCVIAVRDAANAPALANVLARNLPGRVRLLLDWPLQLEVPDNWDAHPAADLLSGSRPDQAPAPELHQPEDVIRALLRRQQQPDALELAVQAAPRLVESLVASAGAQFQRQGRLQRLHVLLSSLEEPWASLEKTLEWRLVAAVAAGGWPSLLDEVDQHLAEWPAPDLRARRAALLPPAQRVASAREALELARTPLTLWQAGRLEPDTETAFALLQESTALAEDSGRPYEAARAAGSLAERHLHAGNLQECSHWSEWALTLLDQADAAEPERRTRILNNLAFTKLLTGRITGMRERLAAALALLDTAASDVRASSLLTLAALHLEEGDDAAAVAACREAQTGAPRRLLARTVHQRVLIWLAAGRPADAQHAAEQAGILAGGEERVVSDSAELAAALLAVLDGDSSAVPLLEAIACNSGAETDLRLTAWLYLALGTGRTPALPAGLEKTVALLTPAGLRSLSAPRETFRPLLEQLVHRGTPLQLRTFGEPEARLDGNVLRLTLRLWEVLTVIALHPAGITDEELHDYLVRDSGVFGLSALRTHVSRLRTHVPVSDSPYRLLCDYSLDINTFRSHLHGGDTAAAAGVFRGALLPKSRAPGISGLRAELEAEYEQAALSSADPEFVLGAATRAGDDLLLWEHCLAVLPEGDGRRGLVTARLRHLRHAYG